MARIPIGRVQVGAVGPFQPVSFDPLRKAAAAFGQAGRDQEKAAKDVSAGLGEFGSVLNQIGKESKANGELIYRNELISDQTLFLAENADLFASDPDLARATLDARAGVIREAAKSSNQSEKSQALIEIGIQNAFTKALIKATITKNAADKRGAFTSAIQTIKDTVLIGAEAIQKSESTVAALQEAIETLELQRKSNLEDQEIGGVNATVLSDGSTYASKIEAEYRRARVDLGVIATKKDITAYFFNHEVDKAYVTLLGLTDTPGGVHGIEYTPRELMVIQTRALSHLQILSGSTPDADKKKNRAVIKEILPLLYQIPGGRAGLKEVEAFIKKHGRDISGVQYATLYNALALKADEPYKVRHIVDERTFVEWVRAADPTITYLQIAAEGKKRGYTLRVIGAGIAAGSTKRSDHLKTKKAVYLEQVIMDIITNGLGDVDARENGLARMQIGSAGYARFYRVLHEQYRSEVATDDIEFIAGIKQELINNPFSYSPASIRGLLVEEGLGKNYGVLLNLVNAHAGAVQKGFAKRIQQINVGTLVSRNLATSNTEGIQDWLTNVEDKNINFSTMTPERMDALRPFFRRLYGMTNTISTRMKDFLSAGLSNTENNPMLRAMLIVYNDLRDERGENGILTDQLSVKVQGFYDTLIARGTDLDTTLVDVLRVRALEKNASDNIRTQSLEKYFKLADKTVDQMIQEDFPGFLAEAIGGFTYFRDFLPFYNAVDLSDFTTARLRVDVQNLMKNMYRSYPEPEDLMKAIAIKIHQLYEVGNYSEHGGLTLLSTDRYWRDATVGTHYIAPQVTQLMDDHFRLGGQKNPLEPHEWRDNGGKGGIGSWFLEPTADSIANRFRKPVYNIWYRDESGGKFPIEDGGKKLVYVPDPGKSQDVMDLKNLAKKFEKKMRSNKLVWKTISDLPGGPDVFIRSEKAMLDAMQWMGRTSTARFLAWVKYAAGELGKGVLAPLRGKDDDFPVPEDETMGRPLKRFENIGESTGPSG